MITFLLKESFKLIGRAKSSFFLSLLSMSISISLIAFALLSINASDYFQSKLKQNINVNVFLKNDLSQKSIKKLRENIKKEKYVRAITYIDKKKAAKIFIKNTGNDFRKLIDYNPLPASFSVHLKKQFINKKSLKNIISDLSKKEGVDEVSLKYDYIYKLISYLAKIKFYIFLFAFVIFSISLYIVYSTIQLVINSKYTELETMKLVGAKLSTIKVPIILNGIFIGAFASFILSIGFYVIYNLLSGYIPLKEIMTINGKYNFLFVVFLGPVIGYFVSVISLRKLTLKY